jgi:hypothetical protein
MDMLQLALNMNNMKLEKLVTSQELSKKLDELGVKCESLFYYILSDDGWIIETEDHFNESEAALGCGRTMREDMEYYPAYLAGELGMILKSLGVGITLNTREEKSEANHRAEFIIGLLERGNIKPEDIKLT